MGFYVLNDFLFMAEIPGESENSKEESTVDSKPESS